MFGVSNVHGALRSDKGTQEEMGMGRCRPGLPVGLAVTLEFDDVTGLPTHINLTWDAVEDGDYGFAIEVTGVE